MLWSAHIIDLRIQGTVSRIITAGMYSRKGIEPAKGDTRLVYRRGFSGFRTTGQAYTSIYIFIVLFSYAYVINNVQDSYDTVACSLVG